MIYSVWMTNRLLTDCHMARCFKSRNVPPMWMLLLGSGGGVIMVVGNNPPPQIFCKVFPSPSVCPPPFLLRPPMTQYPPYKWGGVYLWSPCLPSLLPVCIGNPVLSGHPDFHLNAAMSPMPPPPLPWSSAITSISGLVPPVIRSSISTNSLPCFIGAVPDNHVLV